MPVKTDGLHVFRDHADVHPRSAGPGGRGEEGLRQPAAVARPLYRWQQVDVQVSRVLAQARPQQPFWPVMQRQHLIVGTDRRGSRDQIAAGQARDPPLAVSAGEGGRVRRPEHVAGRPSPVVQDEGQFGGQEEVRAREQVSHQVIAAIPAPGVPAGGRGAHADVVDDGEIFFAVRADPREWASWVRAWGHSHMVPWFRRRSGHNRRMDEAAQNYIDGIDQANRGLFDRVHGLIMAAYPDAAVGISYRIPVYRVGRGRLYVGTWKHGVSIYGWPQGSEAGFVERHPALKTSKGTIRLRPEDASSVTDEELLTLLHAALGGSP